MSDRGSGDSGVAAASPALPADNPWTRVHGPPAGTDRSVASRGEGGQGQGQDETRARRSEKRVRGHP